MAPYPDSCSRSSQSLESHDAWSSTPVKIDGLMNASVCVCNCKHLVASNTAGQPNQSLWLACLPWGGKAREIPRLFHFQVCYDFIIPDRCSRRSQSMESQDAWNSSPVNDDTSPKRIFRLRRSVQNRRDDQMYCQRELYDLENGSIWKPVTLYMEVDVGIDLHTEWWVG